MVKNLISIIVPVYKVELYLKKCVDSIINQTYKNLEIILVDDGSPDNCPEICDEYAKMDSRIKVIHKENSGVASARNSGLNISTGEFIGFLDSDDWVEPDMYQKLYFSIKDNSSDMSMCKLKKIYDNKILFINEFNLRDCNSSKIYPYLLKVNSKNNGDMINCENIGGYVWRCLYKKTVIGSVMFNENIFAEDLCFNAEIFNKNIEISVVDEYLYNYLQREGALTKSKSKQQIEEFIHYIKCCFKIFEDKVSHDEINSYKFYLYKAFFINYIKSIQDVKNYLNNETLNECNTKDNYKSFQKQTTSFKSKIVNYALYKKWYRILLCFRRN